MRSAATTCIELSFFFQHMYIYVFLLQKAVNTKTTTTKKGSSAMKCSIDDALLHNQMDYL